MAWRRKSRGWLDLAAIIGNIVLLGASCWAIIDQYPHPEEAGVIEYELFIIVVPIFSTLVIGRSEQGWLRRHAEKKGLVESK